MNYYEDKKILIIGGTGTIGSKMVTELLKSNPKVIRIFSRDEYKQFMMQNAIKDCNKLRFLIGDVRDYDRVERAMNGIDIVFNLAAMKHVPACEYNPTEAIKTNVSGMENVIKAATYNNVQCVLFTSSDKAINPINAYGATKLLAEKLVQAANFSKGSIRTKFVAVRFGNVMGSRGSVIPFFKKQIIDDGIVTVTDGRMTRFMMTVKQAVNLTLIAAEKALGGEVFVLKMPVLLLQELVDVVVEETSRKYSLDREKINTKVIGLRAGEKMYEELMTEEEAQYAYEFDDMFAVTPTSFDRLKYENFYSSCKKAKIKSYTSNDEIILSKEQLRNIIKNENLI
ncbi:MULTISPECIES: SDR family NAD(P)-dependent oxidoreductase [Clostridium]|uniref:SDR family NAD(P)-dependent oxidoreductase n=1 Tax=Clostridium TaxID=1485 RepID=UPI000826D24E|nr:MULTISPECIES: SDR family NAD(P)-dependent oxidoreductase [Clostridium]PJI09836.1 polysaccharide biosynthesis protein [Clostridium sp. CT7]